MRSFWMKNTILPLDIIFIDEHYSVINYQENTLPFSEQAYPSDKPAKYVVEVNAGFCKRHGIENGTKIGVL